MKIRCCNKLTYISMPHLPLGICGIIWLSCLTVVNDFGNVSSGWMGTKPYTYRELLRVQVPWETE